GWACAGRSIRRSWPNTTRGAARWSASRRPCGLTAPAAILRLGRMQKTSLNGLHHAAGAKLIDFGGWEMPVVYTSIIEEHRHTRESASVFDVSHMGRLELSGAAAEALLQRACTRNVSKLAVGRCGYSHICNERGGILDDVIVS